MPDNFSNFEVTDIRINEHLFKIARIKNPEIYFEKLLLKSSDHPDITDERIPYWCELWPSSIALSKYILKHPELSKGKKVIEIGCGLGLCGIAAGVMGAQVTLTDYLPEAINFAGYNWKLNLDSTPDCRLLDWRTPENFERFDMLLASDVAYESRSFEALIHALKILVKRNGIILISEPNRKFAKDFFIEMESEGFSLIEEKHEVVKDKIHYRISIYEIRRKTITSS
jgi:predicted nicotinamide N-methyase